MPLRRLKTFFYAALLALALPAQSADLPAVTAGKLERLDNFASRHVDARNVDVWLPPGYDPKLRYPVLYMHDGQMLFDPATTWNKQAWQVDKVAARLIAEKKIRPFILVGVWNNGKKRHAEFFPQKYLPHVPEPLRSGFIEKGLLGNPLSDAYLKFLVEELKPAIDQRYSTLTGPEDTFLMGSSMGGMISVYGLCEYSQVFSGAAALSTHWISTFESNTEFPQAATRYLADHLPKPGTRRLYLDRGDQELDAKYGEAQASIDAFMKSAGYREPFFVTRLFAGTGHNERAWSARLDVPLVFLLGKDIP